MLVVVLCLEFDFVMYFVGYFDSVFFFVIFGIWRKNCFCDYFFVWFYCLYVDIYGKYFLNIRSCVIDQ